MKREIKFRGKCSKQSKYAGEWVYGNLVVPEEIQGDEVMIVKALSDDSSCTYHVDVNSVGQFTGKNDKNRKEIYEGDILRNESCKGVVSYRNGAFVLDLGKSCGCVYLFCLDSLLVVGNIYDNPELLKQNEL